MYRVMVHESYVPIERFLPFMKLNPKNRTDSGKADLIDSNCLEAFVSF